MPALRPASQACPMRNPREGTGVVLRDTIQANLMVCVVCSCCATSLYREVCRAKGGIGSGETLCHDIYLARPFFCSCVYFSFYCCVFLIFVLPSDVIKNDNHCFSGGNYLLHDGRP